MLLGSPRPPGWTDGNPPDPISRGLHVKLYLNESGSVREDAAALDPTMTRVHAALRRRGIPAGRTPRHHH